MKILIVTQYFYPEDFKCNDMAFDLSARGYDVTVLTGIPNYPSGSFFKGYGLFRKRSEVINGVKVKRALLTPRGKGGGLRLALNYFSWAFFASVRAFFLSLRYRYDAVIVHEISPVTQGIPAVVVRNRQRIPLYFWVLDLWPESLVSAGGVTNTYVLSFFGKMVRWLYNNSDQILISSRGFEQSILEKGDYRNKLIYFPNWAEDVFSEHTDVQIPALPVGFRVMFAGNIGVSQDFDHIMQAALYLKAVKHIKFILIGDGRRKPWVDEFVRENGLQETVYCLGRFPLETMPAFFAAADVMLLSLKDELIFNLTVPAKLQAYMAAGKPVMGMLNGEGAALIAEARCGIAVPAGASRDLADKITELSEMQKSQLCDMGMNGKRYYQNNFTKDLCMDHLVKILEERRGE